MNAEQAFDILSMDPQPTFLGCRTDISLEDCSMEQLVYKKEATDEWYWACEGQQKDVSAAKSAGY